MSLTSFRRRLAHGTGPLPRLEVVKAKSWPDGLQDVPVHKRPLPGLAITETPMGGEFAITHELSGLAIGFYPDVATAEQGAEFLKGIDWNIPEDQMTDAHRQRAQQASVLEHGPWIEVLP